MAVKGLFFSVDALFGLIIAVSIVAAFSYTMSRYQEDRTGVLYLSNLAGDVLSSMDKNGTLDTLDGAKVNSTLNKILPSSVGYILDVKVFQCSGSGCPSFSEVPAKSFTAKSDPPSEKNSVIAKRVFLTFDSGNRVQYFNKAELRMWKR